MYAASLESEGFRSLRIYFLLQNCSVWLFSFCMLKKKKVYLASHFPLHPTFEAVSMWGVVSDGEDPSSSHAFPVFRQTDWYKSGSLVKAS